MTMKQRAGYLAQLAPAPIEAEPADRAGWDDDDVSDDAIEAELVEP